MINKIDACLTYQPGDQDTPWQKPRVLAHPDRLIFLPRPSRSRAGLAQRIQYNSAVWNSFTVLFTPGFCPKVTYPPILCHPVLHSVVSRIYDHLSSVLVFTMRGDRLGSCPDIKRAGRNVEVDCQVVSSGIQEDAGQVLRH